MADSGHRWWMSEFISMKETANPNEEKDKKRTGRKTENMDTYRKEGRGDTDKGHQRSQPPRHDLTTWRHVVSSVGANRQEWKSMEKRSINMVWVIFRRWIRACDDSLSGSFDRGGKGLGIWYAVSILRHGLLIAEGAVRRKPLWWQKP